MNYYDRFSPEVLRTLTELNNKLNNEETQDNPDYEKILKLKQQILMKGLEMSVGFSNRNYNMFNIY